uniref:ABC transporter ATP-binding protein n=2 Tax=Polynucleobacter sp. TaxID=2029855 RepID=UPI004047DA4E
MITTPSLILLRTLWGHLENKRKKQLFALMILMVFSSLAELLAIGTLFPFLGIMTNPKQLFEMPILDPIKTLFSISNPDQLLLPLTIFFGSTIVVATFVRLILLWANTRLTFAIGADISMAVYFRTLHQPYPVHISRNSSEVIDGISTKANSVIFGVIQPILFLIGSVIMALIILGGLLSFEPMITIGMLVVFAGFYFMIILSTRRRLHANSQRIAQESTSVIKALQEGLGGIRDVLIDKSQEVYFNNYRVSDGRLRSAQASNVFIGQSPRYVIEALGILFISFFAYYLAKQPDGLDKAIPVLGVLALGAQRLLPVLQQAYSSWSSIQGNKATLQDILVFLNQPLIKSDQFIGTNILTFEDSISLHDISFRYKFNAPLVLTDVNFSIPKGACVGIIGISGSGKSTLVDILMGLLEPSSGRLTIDGQAITSKNMEAWQKHIAHVPQQIFLSDCSIEENIALGVPADLISHEKIKFCAEKSQLGKFIDSLPDKYQANVGERGVRLSGGQRQRIGIARALYKNADVIIFDEATSALDSETEAAVMQTLNSLDQNLTIIIIAHRLTTLKNCSKIIEISNGSIKNICSYQDLKLDP